MSKPLQNPLEKTAAKNGPENPAQKNGAEGVSSVSSVSRPVFDVRETRVCAQLRMNKDEVRARRNYFLTQGQHWDYVERRVLYTAVGAQIMLGTREAVVPAADERRPAQEAVARRNGPVALLCEKNPSPIKFKGSLVAWAAPQHNKRVLVCHVPGADPLNPMNLVTLRVRDNSNFMRGMRIPGDKPPGDKVRITPVKERDDVFDLQGPIPRWKGRW